MGSKIRRFFNSIFSLDTVLRKKGVEARLEAITSNNDDMGKQNEKQVKKSTAEVKAFLKGLQDRIDADGAVSLGVRDRAKLAKMLSELD